MTTTPEPAQARNSVQAGGNCLDWASEDTSRRVARAWLQSAQQGQGNGWVGRRRRFGFQPDGTIDRAESAVIRDGARKFLAGESWNSVVRAFQASGQAPVKARTWATVSVQQILLNPSTAGIAVYNGSLRQEDQEGQAPTCPQTRPASRCGTRPAIT